MQRKHVARHAGLPVPVGTRESCRLTERAPPHPLLQTDPGAKDSYWAARIDPASADGATTFGAHMAFLDRLLARSSSGYYLDSGLSVAGGSTPPDACMPPGATLPWLAVD